MSWKSPFPGQIMNKTEFDHYIDIGGINYHYREIRAERKRSVLLHGFASSTYTWSRSTGGFQSSGTIVFSLDMKGFGWSDKPLGADYSPDTLMEDVRAWMEALNLKDVTFAGNSLGEASRASWPSATRSW